MLTAAHIRDGLAGFDHEYRDVRGEQALFARRRNAETAPWHWAWDALIHYRRGNMRCATASWRFAMRLSIPAS